MALSIADTAMTSDLTAHVAQPSGDRWRVSWLPGRALDRNQAVTALTIAETVARWPRLGPGDRGWPMVKVWAAELGLTANAAVRAAGET
jgi:hypothetical protein